MRSFGNISSWSRCLPVQYGRELWSHIQSIACKGISGTKLAPTSGFEQYVCTRISMTCSIGRLDSRNDTDWRMLTICRFILASNWPTNRLFICQRDTLVSVNAEEAIARPLWRTNENTDFQIKYRKGIMLELINVGTVECVRKCWMNLNSLTNIYGSNAETRSRTKWIRSQHYTLEADELPFLRNQFSDRVTFLFTAGYLLILRLWSIVWKFKR